MALSMRDFAPAMGLLCEMLPMQRALSDEALAMAWETMPNAAKIHLTPESLAFAVKQRLLDPDPPKEQALHVQLLRYVFPVDRTRRRERGEEINCDRAILEGGLRADLATRMAAPDRFHDPAPARQEQAAPPTRPQLQASSNAPFQPGRGNGFWHPSQLTPEARRRHVQGVGAELERVLARGRDGRPWSAAHLAQGADWFRRALEGFWPLQCDDGGLAAAWAVRNESLARQLVADALSGAAPALPAADAVPVAAIVGGFASSEEGESW